MADKGRIKRDKTNIKNIMFKNIFVKAVAVATLSAAVMGLMPLAVLADNPVPSISSISPSSVATGSGAFTLTVNGSNFTAGSVVNVNGIGRSTTFVSPTQMTAQLTSSDTANPTSFNVTAVNPGPGGGTSNTVVLTVTGINPTPSISSISPSAVNAGSGITTLTVNGNGFVPGAIVNFNGSSRSTSFTSSNQVVATLNASDVNSAGTFNITVTNPSGGTSNTIGFTVNSTTGGTTNNPMPFISSISPISSMAGSGGLTLTVSGSGFMSGSVVNFNGLSRPTTFVSPTQLAATIYASDQAVAGPEVVTVTNPSPGGGISNVVMFTVHGTTTGTGTPGLPNTGFGPDEQEGINQLKVNGILAGLAALTIVGSLAVVAYLRKAQ